MEAGAQGDPDVAAQAPTLVVRDLNRRFGDHEVVRRLNLVVKPGERVALVGSNGSGKTTLLRCVAGTLLPTGGDATVSGHPAGSLGARRLVGTSLSQERSFYLRLSGRDNLLFFAQLREGSRHRAIMRVRALELELELDEILSERVDRCSTGMIQQLSFARALTGDPALLLLDEPTRSLDRAAVERFWAALEARPATAVMIATHRQDDVDRCTSRLDLPA